MSFIDEIRAKQAKFRDTPLSSEELGRAVDAIKERISRIADDPYYFAINEITIHYVSSGDNAGTCKFWTGSEIDAPLHNAIFYMSVPKFQKVVDEFHKMGFGFSAEYGPTSGHAKLKW